MAVPKKKSSRSRTGMRRYSTAYKMDPISGTTCAFTHEPVRTHTVSMKSIKEGLYNAAAVKKAKSATKKSASAKA
jgi:ribosomal protein L32